MSASVVVFWADGEQDNQCFGTNSKGDVIKFFSFQAFFIEEGGKMRN